MQQIWAKKQLVKKTYFVQLCKEIVLLLLLQQVLYTLDESIWNEYIYT